MPLDTLASTPIRSGPEVMWARADMSKLLPGGVQEILDAVDTYVNGPLGTGLDLVSHMVEVVSILDSEFAGVTEATMRVALALIDSLVNTFAQTGFRMIYMAPTSYKEAMFHSPNPAQFFETIVESFYDEADDNRPRTDGPMAYYMLGLVATAPNPKALFEKLYALMEILGNMQVEPNPPTLSEYGGFPVKLDHFSGQLPDWSTPLTLSSIPGIGAVTAALLELRSTIAREELYTSQYADMASMISKKLRKIRTLIAQISTILQNMVDVAVTATGLAAFHVLGVGTIDDQVGALRGAVQTAPDYPYKDAVNAMTGGVIIHAQAADMKVLVALQRLLSIILVANKDLENQYTLAKRDVTEQQRKLSDK